MKKTAWIQPPIPVLLVTFLALSSIASAQHKMQAAAEGNQSKLVQIVRNATEQYLDINNAIAGHGILSAASAAPTMVRWASITSIQPAERNH